MRLLDALIGDGSFQLTAQEVAQMIRRKLPVIIFLINNHGYTIEVEIHDGPYNNIKNWDYAGLIQAFNAEDGHGRGLRPMVENSRKPLKWETRDFIEATRRVEARGDLIGEGLIVKQVISPCRADGLFIQPHRVKVTTLRGERYALSSIAKDDARCIQLPELRYLQVRRVCESASESIRCWSAVVINPARERVPQRRLSKLSAR
jgi:hypothetical protein